VPDPPQLFVSVVTAQTGKAKDLRIEDSEEKGGIARLVEKSPLLRPKPFVTTPDGSDAKNLYDSFGDRSSLPGTRNREQDTQVEQSGKDRRSSVGLMRGFDDDG